MCILKENGLLCHHCKETADKKITMTHISLLSIQEDFLGMYLEGTVDRW